MLVVDLLPRAQPEEHTVNYVGVLLTYFHSESVLGFLAEHHFIEPDRLVADNFGLECQFLLLQRFLSLAIPDGLPELYVDSWS